MIVRGYEHESTDDLGCLVRCRLADRFFDRLWTGQRQGQRKRQGSRQGRSASRPRWRLLPARGLCSRAALLQRAERSAAGLAQEVLSNRQIAARMGEEDSTVSAGAGAL